MDWNKIPGLQLTFFTSQQPPGFPDIYAFCRFLEIEMIRHNDPEVTWLKEKSGVFLIHLGWKNTLWNYYLLKWFSGVQSSEFKVQEKKLPLILVMSELRGIKAAGTVGLSKTTLDKMPNFRVLRLQGSCLLRGMPLSSQGTRCLGLASDFDTFQAGIKIVGENIKISDMLMISL